MKKIFIPFAVFTLFACTSITEKAVVTEAATTLSTETPETGKDSTQTDGISAATQIDQVSFNGTLVIPPHYFASVTLTMGGTVKDTYLIPGTYVKKGTVLATLENPDFIILQQTYLDSQAQSEYLETEYIRQQNLAKEEAASQKKLQQSKADYLSMKSKMQASAAQLSLLGISPEQLIKTGIQPYLEVKAPLSGFVNNVQMNLGKHIAAGEVLCEVIDKSEMLLRLTTYEKDLADISIGNMVNFTVNGLGQQSFDATLISIGQAVDEVSRSLDVYARVHNPQQLFRPGMYVTAQIQRNTNK